VSYVDPSDNAYGYLRLFGSRRFGDVAATLDLQAMNFDQAGQRGDQLFLGSAKPGLPHRPGAQPPTLAASAGVTPFYQNRFDVVAKLVYQNFPAREVRP